MKANRCENISEDEQKIDEIAATSFRKLLQLFGLKSFTTQTSFGTMHYYDSNPESSQEPLVFIHGLGSSGQSWWILALMFANKCRVIIPDLFYMAGLSQPIKTPLLNFSEHCESIQEFLRKVVKRPANLCGLSLGGWIAMSLGAKYPELVSKLILMNPAGIQIKSYRLRDTLVFLNWKKFQKLYPGLLNVYPYHGIPFFSSVIRRGLYRGLKNQSIKNFIRTIVADDFVDKKLSNIKAPVLLLWGENDNLLDSDCAQVIVNNINDIQGKWVHECAHVLCIEAPFTCYLEINEFLNLSLIEENSFVKFVRKAGHIYKTSPIDKTLNS
ncbi:MAG: alpha/beta hydrolase [Silvanigrellaceae bacterium]|nr:alpha/beta hydrolase [Silvanigrellaceae bacterium]